LNLKEFLSMTNKLDTFIHPIPIGEMFASTGTWSTITNSGVPYLSKAAAAHTTKVMIPVPALGQSGLGGRALTKVEVPVRVATAALVSTPTATLYRRNNAAVAAAGTDMAASTVTTSKTGLTTTAAATDRKITVTVSTPALDTTNNYSYFLQLTFNTATTTALRVYDAIAFYQLPV
jgi:hypothetical protein